MAENPIKNTDFYSGDGKPFEQVIKNLLLLEEQAVETLRKINELGKALKSTGNPTDAASIKEQIALMKELEKEQKKLAEIEKIRASSEKDLAKAQMDLANAEKTRIAAEKQQIKNTEEINSLEEKELGTLEKLTKQNKELNKEKRKLNLETDEGKKRLKEINEQLDKNSKATNNAGTQQSKLMRAYFETGERLRGLGQKLVGLGGVVAGAMVVWEGFKNIMGSTAAGADQLEFAMAGAGGALNGALQTIKNGDWSNLWKNIKTSASAAYDLAEAMDNIEERQQAVNLANAKNEELMSEFLINAKNVNLSYKERLDNIEKYLKLAKENADLNRDVAAQELEAVTRSVQEKTKITYATLQWYLSEKAKNKEVKAGTELARIEDIIMNKTKDGYDKLIDANIKYVNAKKAFNEENRKAIGTSNTLKKELADEANAQAKIAEEKRKANIQKAIQNELKGIATANAKRVMLGEETESKITDTQNIALEQRQSALEGSEKLATKTEEDNRKERQAKFLLDLQEKLDDTKVYADASIDILDTVSNFQQAAMNKELAAAGDNAAKQEEIRKKYAKKEQQNAIAKAVINGALAVGSALLTPPFVPAGLIAAGVAAAKTASEVAVIKSVKFAKGGSWIEGGRLHSQGGNKYGDKELEQGEAVGVLSRKATAKHGEQFASVVDAFNNDKASMFMPSITLKDDNFKDVKKLVEINKMLLNEHKSLNSHLKNQIRQLAPGVYVDGKGNRINIV